MQVNNFPNLYIVSLALPAATAEGPTSVKVEDVDEDSVTLAWTKPKNDGGKKIVGYVVEYKEPGSNRWKTFNDVPCKDTQLTGQCCSVVFF